MDFSSFLPAGAGYAGLVLSFIVALSIIVAIHEYGHYIVGRWSGIHAEVFSLGFGPVLWSRTDRRGTRWQVAAIPLGGYVKFLGDANAASAGADTGVMSELSPEERRHTMHGAPLWARAATVAAGPVFNFILTLVLLTGIYLWSGAPTDSPAIGALKPLPQGYGTLQAGDRILSIEGLATPDWDALGKAVDKLPSQASLAYSVGRGDATAEAVGPFPYPPRVDGVLGDSAAIDAGLKAGDVIESVNGTPVNRFQDVVEAVKAAGGSPLALKVWRDGQTFDVTLVPRKTDQPKVGGGFETSYKIGIFGSYFFSPETRAVGPLEAAEGAARQTWFIVRTSLSGMWSVVTGGISPCNLRGPIGIAESSAQAASEGAGSFISFIALLSTAVGLLNLFPIPMLDGGHLVFYACEWAIGRPLPARVLSTATAMGLALVLALMLFGLTNDLRC